MGLLLAFAPFIAFAVIDRFVGVFPGLCAGAATSLVLLLKDAMRPDRAFKILEVGTCALFVALAGYFYVDWPEWSVITVRLFVDAGLLLIVLISLAVGKPFTMQYAREKLPKVYWETAEFKKTNYVISGVWAGAFLIMVLAEAALLFIPDMPQRPGILVIIAALFGAYKFTSWYPKHRT